MKFAIVVFDFDSTLVDFETLERVIELALDGRADRDATLSEVQAITEEGLRGLIPFNESLARRMALVAPHREHVRKISDEVADRITPSVLQNKDFFTKNAKNIYIVSGGFDELIFPVSDVLDVDRSHVFANEFLYDADGRTIGIDQSRPLSQALGKVKALRAMTLPRPIAMVGDGFTDYEVKKHGVADTFIAYVEHTHREQVVAHADVVAGTFDDVVSCLGM